MTTPIRPPVRWAQRKDIVYLQFDLSDVKNEKIVLSENKLSVSCSSEGKSYEVEIEFFDEVTKEGSKWSVHGKSTEFVIKKKHRVIGHV